MADQEYQAAADTYQACLDLIEQQITAGSNVVQPRDRSVLFNKLGDAQLKLGQTQKAIAAFEAGLEIAQQIADADALSVQAQRDLAYSLAKLTEALTEANDFVQARAIGQQSLAIREILANQDQANMAVQGELASSLIRLAKLEKRAGNLESARNLFVRARPILESMPADTLSGSPAFREMLEDVITELSE
jgi:tetratricopeptide (TPR) repeat protein